MLIAVLVVIPAAAFLVVENSNFQTYIANRFLSTLSDRLGSHISVKKVKLNILSDVVLQDVLVTDPNMDTLLYIPRLRADVDSVSLRDKFLTFDYISFFNPDIRVKQEQDSVFNFQFLLDSLSRKDSIPNKKWDISPGNIRIHNGKIALASPYMPLNINPDIHLSDFNLTLNFKSAAHDSLHLNLRRLQFKEKNGFDLRNMKAEVAYTKNLVSIKKLQVRTENSDINIREASLKGYHIFMDRENLANAEVKLEFSPTHVALSDFYFLYAPLNHSPDKMEIDGSVTGEMNNLYFNDFLFEIQKIALLEFNGQLIDITHPESMFMYANFANLFIKTPALTDLLLKMRIDKPDVYANLNKLENVSYSGELTGLPGNYVAYGTLKTALGVLKTDLSFETDHEDQLSFSGKLSTQNFNLAPFAKKEERFGRITMNIETTGLIAGNQFQGMQMNAFIDSVEVNDYMYKNTDMNGFMAPDVFNGAISINDPNLRLILTGNFNLSKELPVLQFDAEIEKARLDKLKLMPKYEDSNVQLTFSANLKGHNLDDMDGSLSVHNLHYKNYRGKFDIDSLLLNFNPHETEPSIFLSSDVVSGEIKGNYHFGSLFNSIRNVAFDRLPALKPTERFFRDTALNKFTFAYQVQPIDTIAYIFDFPYFVYEGLEINGRLNDYTDEVYLSVNLPHADINGALIEDAKVHFWNEKNNQLHLDVDVSKIDISNRIIENFAVNSRFLDDSIRTRIVWNNNDLITNSGQLESSVKFNRKKNTQLAAHFRILPSSIIMADSQWVIPKSDILIEKDNIRFNNFRMEHENRYFRIDGTASKNITDSIRLNINNFQLGYIQQLLQPKGISFDGNLNGETTINRMLSNPLIQAKMYIDSARFNEVDLGLININSIWQEQTQSLAIDVENILNGTNPLIASGSYTPGIDSLNLDIQLNQFQVEILQPFIESILQNVHGVASGNLNLFGGLSGAYFKGALYAEKGALDINYLNTSYYMADSIYLSKDAITFDNITFYDYYGNMGTLRGELKHNKFRDMSVDLSISAKDLLVLNTSVKENDLYYGTMYASGFLTIKGENANVLMEANVTTMPGSQLYLPINSASKASENDFITYISYEETVEDEVVYRKTKENSGTTEGVFTVRLGVNATPDAQVELIFDETVGDIIKGQGNGLLNFEYVSNGDFTMTGEYQLTKGDYLFTMLNLVNKAFRLEPGGKIQWNGDPFDATLNLDAYYELRAPLYDLMPSSPNAEELKKRFPVQCHMMLSDKLLKPNIEFDIVLPTADVETKRSVESIINTQDELSRQVISLLAMNRFYTPDYMRASMSEQNTTAQSQAAAVTASEFLSSQLSNWLSQISEDVDLGVHYRPGDNTYTNTEVELMLGTQLWNDRIEFNSNVGYRDNQATTSNPNASNFVGDFEVLVKLNQQYHLKAYSRTNDNIFYETSPTTQGVGIIYKEEFNNWQDFWDIQQRRRNERKQKREDKRALKQGDATRVDEE